MNRKQKIIVSVVAILIVTLALVGITYAYFLTAIQGNTNTKSIEVSTANLVVDYGEDTNVIQTKTGLTPGNVAVTKTFSATNHGSDEAGYVAILRDVTYKNTRDNSSINGFERQQDLTYTLTCKQFNESNVETGTCDGVTDTIFPQSTDVSIMVSNKIPVGYTHKYTLTVNYLEAGVDQSHDMAKSFSAKVDIEDIKRLNNPYDTGASPENNKSLAYNIIQNATINKNGTSLVSSPLTKVTSGVLVTKTGQYESIISPKFKGYNGLNAGSTQQAADSGAESVTGSTDIEKCNSVKGKYISYESNCGMYCFSVGKVEDCSTDGQPLIKTEILETEKELSVTEDDYGTSYYYRGNVNNNYVTFNNMCWRIVRIQGDGSIKIILEDQTNPCSQSTRINWDIKDSEVQGSYGYKYSIVDGIRIFKTNYFVDGSMADAFKNFQTTKLSSVISKLKVGDWCVDNSSYDDPNGLNIIEPTLLENYYTNKTGFYHGAYTRISNGKASLKCNVPNSSNYKDGTNMYVGTITADEAAYAGASNEQNDKYYLMNQYDNDINYYNHFFTLSPSYCSFIDYENHNQNDDLVYDLRGTGEFGKTYYGDAYRPAVILKANTNISSGDGTISNPYIVN